MIRKIRKLTPRFIVNFTKHLPLAIVANIKYGFPGKKLRVIGVTGTDGKTTTVNMIYEILKGAGFKVSMISTINAVIGGKSYDTGFHVTSPPSFDIQRYLRKSLEAGDEFMVLEVTSHALEQFRVWGVDFEIGVITNITHEHLDYHKTFENYLKAKAKLIKNVKTAVLNYDDPSFDKLKSLTGGNIVSFSLRNKESLNPYNFPLKLRIPGEYNILNAEAAACVGRVLGVEDKLIKKVLEHFLGLPGRMEEVINTKGVRIIIDFAHTPNALQQVLAVLKKQTNGRLISVFGCASERDKAKRPLMGKISSGLADITILTDEDPRFEDRNKIIEEIVSGMDKNKIQEGKNLFKEADREKAIGLAVSLAKKGDIVGIFGKGHEKSINYQGVEKPWSDQRITQRLLKS